MKRTLSVALIILLLFVASCGTNNNQPSLTVPFVGGNAGLNVGLMNGLPPANVYDNQKMAFGVGIALNNVGEADIGPDTDNPYVNVFLEGFSPRAFGLETSQMSKSLDQQLLGAHKNFDGTILPGMITSVVFEPLMYQDKLQGNIVQSIVADVCYDYENWATAPICFKDSIIERAQDICTLTGEKFPQNSGGPIHVTSLVENPLSANRVMINFVLEHVGTGDFYGRQNQAGAEETCNPLVTNLNKYRVEVSVDSEDPTMDIKCTTLGGDNTGLVTLYSGAPTTVTCTITSTASGTRIFTDPITINTKYRYGEAIVQPVVVQAVGNA
jgi:hypothetical protein